MLKSLSYCSALLVLIFACATAPDAPPVFETFPKIDVHVHYYNEIPGLADMLQSINMDAITLCTRSADPERVKWMETQAEELYSKYGATFRFASTFEMANRYEPGWTENVKKWLEESYKQGAVMTKIWKDIGMEFKTPDGEWLMPDDPVLDPIYEFLTERNIPLIAHLAEPIAAWLPLDPENVHYGYYSTHPEWHFYNKEGVPQHEQIIAARDNILKKHPELVFIGAHMGSQSHDVDVVAQRLDTYENYYVETAARIADLTRQPKEKVRAFLIKYQDRVMYGTDFMCREEQVKLSAEEQHEHVQNLKNRYRRDWQYFTGSGTVEYRGKEVECLELPVEVLEKFYYGNVAKVILKEGK